MSELGIQARDLTTRLVNELLDEPDASVGSRLNTWTQEIAEERDTWQNVAYIQTYANDADGQWSDHNVLDVLHDHYHEVSENAFSNAITNAAATALKHKTLDNLDEINLEY